MTAASSQSIRIYGLACILVLSFSSPALADGHLRWEFPQTPYAERNIPEKVGTNVRDGLVGTFDSVAQGAFSVFAIASPWGGFLVRKVSTVVGDVVGLVDNNPVTRHVFKGVLSRQLLRLGAGAQGFTAGMSILHDTEFTGPGHGPEVFTGNVMFHTDAYVAPSALAVLGGTLISNVLVRPAGGLLTIFGARETGEKLNQTGLDLIQSSLKVKFL